MMSTAASRTTTSATTQQGLTAPQLPTTIDGDGRYVMSLLADFCTDVAGEVNRISGISDEGATAPQIDEFYVSFDREGVLWQWKSVPNALSYELSAGTTLLAQTTDTFSRAAPPSYSGTVTLTAHLADGKTVSTALDYAKPRPHAPTNITLSRTTGGIRISYDDVPPDCIGAQITAGGKTYRTAQSHCLIDSSDRLPVVTVCYYDSFGIGEVTTVTNTVATVTRLFAEQNGEWLDLTWDSLPLVDVRYLVKVAYRAPDWNSALELATVRTNRARLRFPQAGTAYFLVKAFDPYGNTSVDAAWTTLDRTADYRRNVIVTLDQRETAYSGTKTNLYYDATASGLRLDDDKRRGEYIFSVRLPKVYRARNWLESKLIGVTNDTLIWDDAAFRWASEDSSSTVWNGACGDISGATLRTEIAEAAEPKEGETVWTMNGTLLADDETAPTAAQHADTFTAARWNQGLVLSPLTRLAYTVPARQTFGIVFHLITDGTPHPADIITLTGDSGAITLRYDGSAFRLIGTDGIQLTVPYTTLDRDFLAVGIEQTSTHRTLRLASLTQQTDLRTSADAAPCANVTELCWHPC